MKNVKHSRSNLIIWYVKMFLIFLNQYNYIKNFVKCVFFNLGQMHVTYSPLIYSTTELNFKQMMIEKHHIVYFRTERVCMCVLRDRERIQELKITLSYLVLYT